MGVSPQEAASHKIAETVRKVEEAKYALRRMANMYTEDAHLSTLGYSLVQVEGHLADMMASCRLMTGDLTRKAERELWDEREARGAS